MASIITLTGIDEALSNLNYRNKNSLKYRVIHSIRDFYADEASIESIKEIETDKLIKLLWDTGDDPTIIKKKRRNFSSIKSSINSDLKRLYQDEKNLEGLTIGPTNIFDVSDEAKEEILKNFTYGAKGETVFTMSQITEVLKVVNDILSKPEEIADEGGADALGKLDQLRDLIQGLSEKIGLGEVIEEAAGEDDLEEVEVIDEPEEVEEVIEEGDPEEEIEEIDEDDVVEDLEDDEVDEAIEEAEVEEGLEEAEIEEDVEEAEVEGDLEDIEVVEEPEEVDEVIEEIDPEEEIEEIDEDDVLEDIGEGYSDGGYEEGDEIEKARLLAEEFNNYLGAIDKFYNHYLLIPEGEYIVGGKHSKKNEKPEQKVHLSPFYIGKFPVTNALFEIFVEKTGYRTNAERVGYGTVYYGRYQKKVNEQTGLETLTWNSALVNKTVEGACWYQPLGPGSTLHGKRNHPVVQVRIEDAMAFAAWTGKRLPTEDEWEAASRTAKGYRFPWGNEWRENSCNIEKSHIGDTTPVDKYIGFANDFGIVDILGNVLEWTQDSSNPHSDGKNRSRYHIVKGGNWTSDNDIRLLSRFKLESESYANILGFRCVAY